MAKCFSYKKTAFTLAISPEFLICQEKLDGEIFSFTSCQNRNVKERKATTHTYSTFFVFLWSLAEHHPHAGQSAQ
jgi:hypothetical protein